MKTNTKKRHLALGLLVTIFALCFTSVNLAATKTTTTNTGTTNQNGLIDVGNTGLAAQTVNEGDLNIQFRYKDLKLTDIRFLNVSKNVIQLNVLNNKYILGPNDSIIINPPNVKYLSFTHQVYVSPMETAVSNVLTERFGQIHEYQLPKNIDTKTAK